MKTSSILKTLFNKYRMHYVLFWVLLYIGMVLRALALSDLQQNVYPVIMISNATYLLATSVYACLVFFFLLPRYGYNKKFLQFFVYSLIGLLAVSIVNAFTDQWVYVNYGVHPVRSNVVRLLPSEIFFTFLISASFGAIKIADDHLRARWRSEELMKEKLFAELEVLKAQIHPHFLFNTLNNLYVMISKDPARASEMLLKLSDILRYQLYESSTAKIPLAKELENINNYIELEKLRKDDNLSLTFNVSGNINNCMIAPYLLLPFVENAFKHLSNYEKEKNMIEILLSGGNNSVSFKVRNSKENITGSNGASGIGMKNLKRRLELLYPKRHHLSINESGKFYDANLEINISGVNED